MSTIIATISAFFLASVLPVVIIAAIGILIICFATRLLDKILEKSKLEKAAHSLIRSVARVILYGLLALIIADKLGINVTGVVALASVLTLAISLSVQNILTNVFGGFTLMTTKPFSSGDFVEIAGQSGTVMEIGMTYTKLETPDRKLVSIPNSAVTAAQIINYSVIGTRRIDIAVSASYDAPVEQVLEALRQAARVPTALEEPVPFAAVKNYGESTIEYMLQVWSTADDYWTTLFDVNKNIKAVFEDKGVQMSYPHLNVHLDK